MKILFLIGSVNGKAKNIAKYLRLFLQKEQCWVDSPQEPDITLLLKNHYDLILCCTSTTGLGELPYNLRNIYNQLNLATNSNAINYQPYYAIITLGDSSFKNTYARAGKLMQDAISKHTNKLVYKTLIINELYHSNYIQLSLDWIKKVINSLEKIN